MSQDRTSNRVVFASAFQLDKVTGAAFPCIRCLRRLAYYSSWCSRSQQAFLPPTHPRGEAGQGLRCQRPSDPQFYLSTLPRQPSVIRFALLPNEVAWLITHSALATELDSKTSRQPVAAAICGGNPSCHVPEHEVVNPLWPVVMYLNIRQSILSGLWSCT